MKLPEIALIGIILCLTCFCSSNNGTGPVVQNQDDPPEGLSGAYLGQTPPGDTPVRFAQGVISTNGREFAISFSPDGKECFYTKSLNNNTIMHAKEINNVWTDPSVATFSGNDFDFEPLFTPDGNRVVFGSDRSLPGTNTSDLHQWYMGRSGSDWTTPAPLETPFQDRFVMYITFSENGNAYYTGDDGIYFSEYSNGVYQDPEKLGANINSFNNPAHPYISLDESYLIFDAQPEEGNADLFISFRDDSGNWSPAQSLGETMNTGIDELCAFVSYDGDYFFFSRLTDTTGDIYWVDASFIEDFRGNQPFQPLTGEYLGLTPPGMTPEIFAQGVISNEKVAHSAPVFAPDGNEVFWTVGYTNPWVLRTLFMKIENGQWTAPSFTSFSPQGSMPYYSTDGTRIYYLENSSEGKTIKVMNKTETGWSDPASLGNPFVSADLGWQFSITNDGTLYYCLQNGDYGLWDVYRSRLVEGSYSMPENLGANINSESYEGSPYISPDESYLIFSSLSRPNGFGGSDIYISFRQEDGTWSPAVNMGNQINTSNDDAFPVVSPDGEYLFFVSYRNNSQDIYWVDADVINSLRELKIK
ncbi:MAG: hypothetical protein GY863_19685 [bacterium]|nr:hypothetical protein [bacterium]